MSDKLHSPGEYYVTIGSVGRSSTVVGHSGKAIISFVEGNFKPSINQALSLHDVNSSLIKSAVETNDRIDEPHIDLFLDSIFLALEDTDKRIEGMQESIDSNKKDIREMLDRIKELVVDAR
jgi:hypothetical protein